MQLHKYVLTVIKSLCCLLLIAGCASQGQNNHIIIDDETNKVQFQNTSETIKNFNIEQNTDITIVLPRELPIYQWECPIGLSGVELIERKTTTLGESGKKEGETNIADVFVFQVTDIDHHTLELDRKSVV